MSDTTTTKIDYLEEARAALQSGNRQGEFAGAQADATIAIACAFIAHTEVMIAIEKRLTDTNVRLSELANVLNLR